MTRQPPTYPQSDRTYPPSAELVDNLAEPVRTGGTLSINRTEKGLTPPSRIGARSPHPIGGPPILSAGHLSEEELWTAYGGRRSSETMLTPQDRLAIDWLRVPLLAADLEAQRRALRAHRRTHRLAQARTGLLLILWSMTVALVAIVVLVVLWSRP